MLELLLPINIPSFFSGFILGVLVGLVVGILMNRESLTLDKKVATIVFSVWILIHIAGFIFAMDVPNVFDFVGAGATGNLIGFDIGKVYEKLKRR